MAATPTLRSTPWSRRWTTGPAAPASAPRSKPSTRHWSRRVLGGGALALLVSDGLDREAGAGLAAAADRLRRSCRRLVWLNPLLRYREFEPKAAGVRALLPCVDSHRPVHDLDSLEALARSLGGDRGALL